MAMARTVIVEKPKGVEQCIEDCLDCHSVCLETAVDYCLKMGGRHASQNHIRLMLDCSEICQASANFMLRGSVFGARICSPCAEVCDQCAESCDQFSGDSKMAACADVCRRTADSCRQMSGMHM